MLAWWLNHVRPRRNHRCDIAGDLPAAAALLDQNVVFHSPVLATTGDEVHGPTIVAKILQTVFACCGAPRNVEEFQNPDGRYIVAFDGSIGGNLIKKTTKITENSAAKVESIRFAILSAYAAERSDDEARTKIGEALLGVAEIWKAPSSRE